MCVQGGRANTSMQMNPCNDELGLRSELLSERCPRKRTEAGFMHHLLAIPRLQVIGWLMTVRAFHADPFSSRFPMRHPLITVTAYGRPDMNDLRSAASAHRQQTGHLLNETRPGRNQARRCEVII